MTNHVPTMIESIKNRLEALEMYVTKLPAITKGEADLKGQVLNEMVSIRKMLEDINAG